MELFELDPKTECSLDDVAPSPRGLLKGKDPGSISYSLVLSTDSELKKNNRLTTLMEVHGKWRQKGALNTTKKQEEVEQMARQKETFCDGCGKLKALSMCSGDLLCSSCAALAGAVSSRPALVAKMIIHRGKPAEFIDTMVEALGQEWLMQAVQKHLPEKVAVQVENDTLDQIAKVVGYEGDSGEGLVETIESHEAIRRGGEDRTRRLSEIIGYNLSEGSAEGLVMAVGSLVNKLQADYLAITAIRGRLGLSMDDDVTAAIVVREQALDGYRQQAERLTSENESASEQFSRLKHEIANLEQDLETGRNTLVEIAHHLGCPGSTQAELVAKAEELASFGSLKLVSIERPGRIRTLDSCLLDIALETMRGQITGLGPDRIDMLREAA